MASTSSPSRDEQAVPWISISYNVSGAITAISPVSYTSVFVVLVGALTIWHFMLLMKAFSRGLVYNPNWQYATVTMMRADIILQFILNWAFFALGISIWGFAAYIAQQRIWINSNVPPGMQFVSNLPAYLPQDAFNFSLWGIAAFQLIVWRVTFFSYYHHAKELRRTGFYDKDYDSSRGWLVFFCTITSAAFNLFLGWYPFALYNANPNTVPKVYVDGVAVEICPTDGCYVAAAYSPIIPLIAATGTLLALEVILVSLSYVWRVVVVTKSNKSGEIKRLSLMRADELIANTALIDFKPAVFFVGEGPALSYESLSGWVPYFRLTPGHMLTNFFFLPLVYAVVTHDLVKGAVFGVVNCLVVLLYAAIAQDFGAYYSFQMTAILFFIGLMYFAGSVVYPATIGNELIPNDETMFVLGGMMLTGPDSNTNVVASVSTLQALTYISFGLICATWIAHGITMAWYGVPVFSRASPSSKEIDAQTNRGRAQDMAEDAETRLTGI